MSDLNCRQWEKKGFFSRKDFARHNLEILRENGYGVGRIAHPYGKSHTLYKINGSKEFPTKGTDARRAWWWLWPYYDDLDQVLDEMGIPEIVTKSKFISDAERDLIRKSGIAALVSNF